MEVIRYAFCILNFLFLITGAALVGIGVWLLVDDRVVGNFIPTLQERTQPPYSPFSLDATDSENNPGNGNKLGGNRIFPGEVFPKTMISPLGWVCIVFGAFVFFLSFLGYCGALQDSVCLLGGYSMLLGIVFVLEIVAVILFFVYKPAVEQTAKEQLLVLLNERYSAVAVTASEAKSRARILYYNPNKNLNDGNQNNDNNNNYPEDYNGSENENNVRLTNDANINHINDNGRMEGIQVKPEAERDMTRNNFKEVVIFTKLFDSTMRNFQCCGVNNYLDFRKDQLKPHTELPEACCKYDHYASSVLKDSSCVYEPNELNSYYLTGCFYRVIESVTEFGIIGFVIVGLLQIVGIVFSACGTRMIYQHTRST